MGRGQNLGTFVALSIRKRHIDIQIEYMTRYNKELEAKFRKDLNETEKYYSKKIIESGNSSDDAETWADLCFEDREAIDEFIRTFRHSLLVNLFSFLETSLNKICLIVGRAKGVDKGPKDLRDQGVDKFKTYLKKICSINFPSDGEDWQKIKTLNSVRNQIVHGEGIIRNKKKGHGKKLYNSVKSTDGLSLDRDRLIIVEEDYLPMVIVNIYNLLNTVLEESRKAIRDSKKEH